MLVISEQKCIMKYIKILIYNILYFYKHGNNCAVSDHIYPYNSVTISYFNNYLTLKCDFITQLIQHIDNPGTKIPLNRQMESLTRLAFKPIFNHHPINS